MSVADELANHFSEKEPGFREIWEDEARKQMHELSCQLIALRLKMGLNQTEFAQRIGVSQPFLSRLEGGEENISIRTLQRILQKAGAHMTLNIEYQGELMSH